MLKSERIYDTLKSLKGSSMVMELLQKDGSKVICSSTNLKVSKKKNIVNVEFHEYTSFELDLENVENYSIVYNSNSDCEQFIMMLKTGSKVEMLIDMEETKQGELIIEPLNPEEDDEWYKIEGGTQLTK